MDKEKIVVLIRYPRVETAIWKKDLIERLIENGFDISLVFGESGIWRQFKAGFKIHGFNIFKRKIRSNQQPVGGKNLNQYFKKKLVVKMVSNLNSKSSEGMIKKMKPDYLLLLGSGIIRQNILNIPRFEAVHCHHGKLPDFRGVNTAEWSFLLSGKVYLTAHVVDAGIDTGSILLDKRVNVSGINTVEILRRTCREESVGLLCNTFAGLKNDEVHSVRQEKGKGRQYFVMHPVFRDLVEEKLKSSRI